MVEIGIKWYEHGMKMAIIGFEMVEIVLKMVIIDKIKAMSENIGK